MARIVRSRNGFLNCPSCYLARVQGISTGLPDIEWDRELFAGGGHVMQSRPWMAVQQALGDRVVHQSGVGWRWAGVHHRRRGVSYLYLPYGPALEDSARLGDALDAIRAAGRSLSVDFVRVEPDLVVASAAIAAAAAEPGDAAGRFPDPAVARAGVATDRRLAVRAAGQGGKVHHGDNGDVAENPQGRGGHESYQPDGHKRTANCPRPA